MGNHNTEYVVSERGLGVCAICSCGWRTKHYPVKQMAEDEEFKHRAQVERVRAALGTRTPSLKSQRDYFRQMAEDKTLTAHDRRLWWQLHDELDRRLGVDDVDQPTLL